MGRDTNSCPVFYLFLVLRIVLLGLVILLFRISRLWDELIRQKVSFDHKVEYLVESFEVWIYCETVMMIEMGTETSEENLVNFAYFYSP